MEPETNITQLQERVWSSKLAGTVLVVVFHLLIVLFLSTTGFRTIHPTPQDQGILIEFLPDPVYVRPRAIPGQQPRSPNPDPNREVRIIQQAIAAEINEGQVRTQQSTPGETGDVPVYEPPTPKPINERALFRSRDTGDSLADQRSRVVESNAMQAGHPDGNTKEGNPDGTPSAALAGRSVLGSLPLPDFTANVGGTVVVRIMVDQYGNVTSASVTQTGTTVQNRTLWDAAVRAAKQAKFNVSAAAPLIQEGTITYVFILR